MQTRCCWAARKGGLRNRNSGDVLDGWCLLQVNATGVMPVIFSTTLLSLPTGLAKYADWLEPVAVALGPTGLLYLPVRQPPHEKQTSSEILSRPDVAKYRAHERA